MRNETIEQDNRKLIGFWNQAFALSEEEKPQILNLQEDWKALAPSEKLFQAAASLGRRKKVLDFGCGTAWAAIITAKSGCPDVTAADAAPAALQAAGLYAARYGVPDRIRFEHAGDGWLQGIPAETYDGVFCSNVLDVIPPETAEELLREFARILAPDGILIVGLNYYLSPEAAAARGTELAEGRRLYVDGVLRLVSRTDGEWAQIFSSRFIPEEPEHFAWPGEEKETRRLFRMRKREDR